MAANFEMGVNDQSGDQSPVVVELDLPLGHRHASTVRVVAASLGADAGLTVDEIEDLRLGVNEAVSVLADVDADDGARLGVRFEIVGSGMTVIARRSGVERTLSIDDIDTLAVRILRAVVDDFRVDDDGAFVVVKNALARDGD
jgi:serine/threonine-protein kinase RsbW